MTKTRASAWPSPDDPSSARTAALMLLALFAVGCGTPERTVKASVAEDTWQTLKPSTLQARTGQLEGGKLELAQNDKVIAVGPLGPGVQIPVTVDGHPCVVTELSEYQDSHTTTTKSRRANWTNTKTTEWQGVNLELSCTDGPVPGTDASKRGSNPRRSFPPIMSGVAFGLGVGVLAERERWGLMFLIALGGLAAGVAMVMLLGQGSYDIPLGLAFLGYAVIGVIGGVSSTRMGKPIIAIASAGPAVFAAIPVVLLHHTWSPGGPLVGLAAALGAAIIGVVVWAVASGD